MAKGLPTGMPKRLLRLWPDHAGVADPPVRGSTGLDDWEWGVTLLAHKTDAIKEIAYEMHFDEEKERYSDFGPLLREPAAGPGGAVGALVDVRRGRGNASAPWQTGAAGSNKSTFAVPDASRVPSNATAGTIKEAAESWRAGKVIAPKHQTTATLWAAVPVPQPTMASTPTPTTTRFRNPAPTSRRIPRPPS